MANFVYKTVPYKHQEDAVYAAYGKEYFAFFMQQGTGKTKVTIDEASNLFLEKKITAVLLIAPNGVHEQWADEQLPIHSPVPYSVQVWDGNTSDRKMREVFQFIKFPCDGLKWFCVNIDAFSHSTWISLFRDFVMLNKTYVVVDEATRIKNPEAKRTQNVIQGLNNVSKVGKRITGIQYLSLYRRLLTGTQVTNGPYNLWSMGEFLKTNLFGRDYFSFKARYGMEVRMAGARGDYYRKITREEIESVRKYAKIGKDPETIATIMKVTESSVRFILDNPSVRVPYKHLEELKEIVNKNSFQVLKKDCFDLPPKIYEKIPVQMKGEQLRVYKELKAELLAEYEGVEASVVNRLVLIGRLQQVTGGFFPGDGKDNDTQLIPFDVNPKLDAMVEKLEEASDYPVIVMARFVAELHACVDRFKKEFPDLVVELVCGEVTGHKRMDVLNRFKAGEVDILVANPDTIATGFNLQVSHTILVYSNSFNYEHREQGEDRIHRNGQTESCLYMDFVMKGTVDEHVLRALKDKRDLLEYMRDRSLKQFIGGEDE